MGPPVNNNHLPHQHVEPPLLAHMPVYNPKDFKVVRIYQNFRFATKSDLGERPANLAPNFLEKFGNVILHLPERLPKMILNVINDPRFVTLALTVLALGLNSYIFYPEITVSVVKAGIALLPTISYATIKFAAYIATSASIVALGCRAQGRFMNEDLQAMYFTNRQIQNA